MNDGWQHIFLGFWIRAVGHELTWQQLAMTYALLHYSSKFEILEQSSHRLFWSWQNNKNFLVFLENLLDRNKVWSVVLRWWWKLHHGSSSLTSFFHRIFLHTVLQRWWGRKFCSLWILQCHVFIRERLH